MKIQVTRLAAITVAALLFALLAACGNGTETTRDTSASPSQSISASLPAASSTPDTATSASPPTSESPPEPTILKVEVGQSVVYTTKSKSGNYTYLYAAAELSNTGNQTAKIDTRRSSIDIEDEDGHLVYHFNSVDVSDDIIGDDGGYIYASDMLDKDELTFDVEKCKQISVVLLYDEATAIPARLDAEDVSINKVDEYFSIQGRLIGWTLGLDISATPVVALYDENDIFLGVGVGYSVDIPPEQKVGFSINNVFGGVPAVFPKEKIVTTKAYGSYEIYIQF